MGPLSPDIKTSPSSWDLSLQTGKHPFFMGLSDRKTSPPLLPWTSLSDRKKHPFFTGPLSRQKLVPSSFQDLSLPDRKTSPSSWTSLSDKENIPFFLDLSLQTEKHPFFLRLSPDRKTSPSSSWDLSPDRGIPLPHGTSLSLPDRTSLLPWTSLPRQENIPSSWDTLLRQEKHPFFSGTSPRQETHPLLHLGPLSRQKASLLHGTSLSDRKTSPSSHRTSLHTGKHPFFLGPLSPDRENIHFFLGPLSRTQKLSLLHGTSLSPRQKTSPSSLGPLSRQKTSLLHGTSFSRQENIPFFMGPLLQTAKTRGEIGKGTK
ncbi:hypothetical protein AVEN_55664-1, partial [Araneus ventricosus]